MTVSHIVSMSTNRVIGTQGKLPWHLPEDLALFKKITSRHIIIMGAKTFQSLPHLLPNRFHIVVSRQTSFVNNYRLDKQLPVENNEQVIVAHSVADALQQAESRAHNWGEEIFVIGGESIFLATMDLAERLYITEIHRQYSGDVYYPEFDKNQFRLLKSEHFSTATIPFTFSIWER